MTHVSDSDMHKHVSSVVQERTSGGTPTRLLTSGESPTTPLRHTSGRETRDLQ